MSDVTKSTAASADTGSLMKARQTSGDLYAGEALGAVVPCYIKASDGKVYQSNGTAPNEAAKFDGFTAGAVDSGAPVTLYGLGARFQYGAGLAIGQDLYISATAGALSTTPTAGGLNAIARVITATDIRITKDSEGTGTPVAGVAAGYKMARGQLTTVTAADTVVTGLATVVAVVATLDSDPVDDPEWVSATIGDQAGAPAAGSVIIKTWKNTAGTDPTPTPATTFSKKVNWIAFGT